ncbi:uncharacterized protein MELLADRAFT_101447 [Melampsora larici-populina 98AG31]|uniref:Secreted protein n=1 Tax=Melampsora larici-populina (strain 98AG31 / pathotype 3-4-7) TaxID=747676 RepID=F4R4S2_MELLP|nr:uncharacterized protein MELLADRAFT_101447 [Melampsora larici-populina 98AG31]EGG12858.1 secreted protein [Melampsora larici-populina 98AG31]
MQFFNRFSFLSTLLSITVFSKLTSSTITFKCENTETQKKSYLIGICASGSAESTYPNKYIRVRNAINATYTSTQNQFICNQDYPTWWAYCCATSLPTGSQTAKDCILAQLIQSSES